MGNQLQVKVIINSSVEEALGWKCCNLMDMNLEIMVENLGPETAWIRSEVELAGEGTSERIEYLYPHGLHPIAPRDALSFYCSFDPDRFKRFSRIILVDGNGKRYQAAITGEEEPALEK